jgi:hypothetical protein
VDNYFNYFTEIEEHFQRRRGAGLLVSTLDWDLIETWKNAGIPLAAVLRGIDDAFDKYEQRPSKSRKINGLAYCSQAVLTAAEDMREAAVGTSTGPSPISAPKGFDAMAIVDFLRRSAEAVEKAGTVGESAPLQHQAKATAESLRALAEEVAAKIPRLEDLERRLTVLEEKLFAILLVATPDNEIVRVRAQADREMAPYRSKMPAAQIEQLQKQFMRRTLLEKYGLPRLSLFYM